MKCAELFKLIKDTPNSAWKSSDKELNWLIKTDNDSKKIRLLFEESNGFRDWFYNFLFFGIFYKKNVYKNQKSVIKAHVGFVTAYKSANDEIMKLLIQEINLHPDYEVVISGWSHGGAQSQLAAEDLNYRTRKDKCDPNTGVKPKVVTFGSPKVFIGKASVQYVRSCCSDIIQIAQKNDLVSYMPPFPKFKQLDSKIKFSTGRIGDKFSLSKLFDPWKYHTSYDDYELYDNSFDSIDV